MATSCAFLDMIDNMYEQLMDHYEAYQAHADAINSLSERIGYLQHEYNLQLNEKKEEDILDIPFVFDEPIDMDVADWDDIIVDFAHADSTSVWDDAVKPRDRKTRKDVLTLQAAVKAQKSSKSHKLRPRTVKRDKTKTVEQKQRSKAKKTSHMV